MDGQQALQKWVADYKKRTRKQSGGRISTIEPLNRRAVIVQISIFSGCCYGDSC